MRLLTWLKGHLVAEPDEPVELPVIDETPKNGEFVDHEDSFGDLDDEEIAAGNRLGEQIDTDDDDNGGVGDE